MTEPQWVLISQAAVALGVSREALKKWRWRGSVPHKWRLPLIAATEGRLSAEAFEAPSEAAE